MTLFSEREQTRISEAITSAEAGTSGEIVAVLADQSDDYAYFPILWAAILALLVPWPFIFFTWVSVQTIYAIQLAVFFAIAFLGLARPVRLFLVPKSIKHTRAHRHAFEQFLSQGMHTTKKRTGVLIFVSAAERFAEIIADDGIYQKVPKDTWQEIVDGLIGELRESRPADGFVGAIEASGALLAEHFPPGTDDPNELPNHLIILD